VNPALRRKLTQFVARIIRARKIPPPVPIVPHRTPNATYVNKVGMNATSLLWKPGPEPQLVLACRPDLGSELIMGHCLYRRRLFGQKSGQGHFGKIRCLDVLVSSCLRLPSFESEGPGQRLAPRFPYRVTPFQLKVSGSGSFKLSRLRSAACAAAAKPANATAYVRTLLTDLPPRLSGL
jgi:hypothetical protein